MNIHRWDHNVNIHIWGERSTISTWNMFVQVNKFLYINTHLVESSFAHHIRYGAGNTYDKVSSASAGNSKYADILGTC